MAAVPASPCSRRAAVFAAFSDGRPTCQHSSLPSPAASAAHPHPANLSGLLRKRVLLNIYERQHEGRRLGLGDMGKHPNKPANKGFACHSRTKPYFRLLFLSSFFVRFRTWWMAKPKKVLAW
eukprot:1179456-Prorocentrum_minimum.AAC.1